MYCINYNDDTYILVTTISEVGHFNFQETILYLTEQELRTHVIYTSKVRLTTRTNLRLKNSQGNDR